jgi:hypothetical protein
VFAGDRNISTWPNNVRPVQCAERSRMKHIWMVLRHSISWFGLDSRDPTISARSDPPWLTGIVLTLAEIRFSWSGFCNGSLSRYRQPNHYNSSRFDVNRSESIRARGIDGAAVESIKVHGKQ